MAWGRIEARRGTHATRALLRLVGREGRLPVEWHTTRSDQAETLLLNLLRGSGPAGLAGIGAVQTLRAGTACLRPMLGVPTVRPSIGYAGAACADWIDDPSNVDTRFDRNFLRREILPRAHIETLAGGCNERLAPQRRCWPGKQAELAGRHSRTSILTPAARQAGSSIRRSTCSNFLRPRQRNLLRRAVRRGRTAADSRHAAANRRWTNC